jgi:hypothetical protein
MHPNLSEIIKSLFKKKVTFATIYFKIQIKSEHLALTFF